MLCRNETEHKESETHGCDAVCADGYTGYSRICGVSPPVIAEYRAETDGNKCGSDGDYPHGGAKVVEYFHSRNYTSIWPAPSPLLKRGCCLTVVVNERIMRKIEIKFWCSKVVWGIVLPMTGDMQRFRIGRLQGVGLALFARRTFTEGEFVAEYTGRRIPTVEADALSTRYLFEIDKDWTIDGSPRSNIARYMNHSCFPNCETDIVDGKILITALRDIEIGEELTFDYGEEYFDEFIKPYGCRCVRCAEKSAVTSR